MFGPPSKSNRNLDDLKGLEGVGRDPLDLPFRKFFLAAVMTVQSRVSQEAVVVI